jgi:hypothetical protein
MAKPQENPSANKIHNSQERTKIMREVASAIISLKAERSEISAQITEQRGRVKSLDIQAAEFNVVLRYMELEAEDRNKGLDGLRECFEALLPGENLDWITVTSAGESNQPVGAAAAAGEKAGKAGKPFDSNPYPSDTPANKSWAEAWEAAQANNLKDLGTGAAAH